METWLLLLAHLGPVLAGTPRVLLAFAALVGVVVSKSLLRLAGFDRPREVALARAEQARAEQLLRQGLDRDEQVFRAEMARRGRTPHVQLGTSLTDVPYRLSLHDLSGTFGHFTAGTGAGKSRAVLNVVAQLLDAAIRGERVAIVVFDVKGGVDSLADLTLRLAASHAQAMGTEQRAQFLGRLFTLRFFKGPYLPELQLLRREPSVTPTVQAAATAEILDHAIGTNLGARQGNALANLLTLGIEAAPELTLVDFRWLLYDPARVLRLAAASRIPAVRLYVKTRFLRENAVTIDGLAARADALLADDALKACLCAKEMFDFRRCFRPGSLTVINLEAPSMGEEAREALAALLWTRINWALFDPDRPLLGTTYLFFDEVQNALHTPSTVRHLAKLVSESRSFLSSAWMIHQGSVQMEPETQAILAQNLRLRLIGRGSASEVRSTAAEWLPRTGLLPRPRLPGAPRSERPEFLSAAEELAARVEQVSRLPRQNFLVGDAAAPFGSRVIVTPDINPPAWSTFPDAIREAVLRGSAGSPRAELVARAEAIETAAVASLEASQAENESEGGRTRTRRTRAPSTPDVVTGRGRRGSSGGEVP